jgi:glycosyltransferase involved in cell wall biosynthesis
VAPEIEARSSVIHNGVDPPVDAPSPLPFDEPRVLCLGQLAPHKGFDLAVRACAVVRAGFPRLRLIVAGEGPARRDLEALVEREGLGAAVDFVGRVAHADVPELLDTVTLVALPSRREAFSLVALEAAVMGRPVVAARVDGLPEAVADRETGLLVDPESPVALAAAITFLLTHPAAAVAMGAAGRRRAAREFGLARHVDAYDRLYRTLREGPVPG